MTCMSASTKASKFGFHMNFKAKNFKTTGKCMGFSTFVSDLRQRRTNIQKAKSTVSSEVRVRVRECVYVCCSILESKYTTSTIKFYVLEITTKM